ncbi:MAG: deoxyguanosinetriphosphate triphosphohydrolase [Desulfarculales bacterium]|jgi:dGTPase|nr:deoxyguanosinetriphosphate triphosphohydrolase [Desulfarculales bacterium]
MNLREQLEKEEDAYLSPQAMRSRLSRGRSLPEPECAMRPAFQRDRDRILYSKAFRRLKHKTQVFLAPAGDHYHTRLTHTLEVSQIARSMARALRLNQDLAEAIALGHDLGHAPFGHAGETTLNQLAPGGFQHWQQSLRVVDHLERAGQGLNLTYEVRMGIWGHSKGRDHFLDRPAHIDHLTLEAQLVRAADLMAYLAHDADDAIRGGVLTPRDLPPRVLSFLGPRMSQQIGGMIQNLIENTAAALAAGGRNITVSQELSAVMMEFREFLYRKVYENQEVHHNFIKASKILRELYAALLDDRHFFRLQIGEIPAQPGEQERAVIDHVAGMTDIYALNLYQKYFMPQPWGKI